jgi:hypothetical protein
MNIFDTLYPMDENKNGIEKLPIFSKKVIIGYLIVFYLKIFFVKIGLGLVFCQLRVIK